MSSLNFDLNHLSIFDHENYSKEQTSDENFLLNKARESFMDFFSKLSKLDHVDEFKVNLPKPNVSIPREKPLPIEKPKTRWEQFVQQKGLKFEKKEKKVFDESSGEWKLRYGYKRANDPKETWLIEVPNDPTFDDPFKKLEKDKKTRVLEQERREKRNIKRSARAINEVVVTSSVKGKKKKDEAKFALEKASHPTSSASMNQFNKVKNKVGIFEEGSQIPKIFNRNKGQYKKK